MKRNRNIDILKGIGIIATIVGHLNHFFDYESKILAIIYSFHMPLFIFSSGYLFAVKASHYPDESKLTKKYIETKFSSLMVPYFMFSLLTIFVNFTISDMSVYQYIGGMFVGNNKTGLLQNVALWFLPMLFCGMVVFSGIYTLASKNKSQYMQLILLALCLGTSLIGYFLMKTGNTYIWNIDVALFVQIFLMAGFYFREIEPKLMDKKNPLVLGLFSAGLLTLWILSISINGRIDLNGRHVGNVFVFLGGSISATIFLYLFSTKIVSKVPLLSCFLEECGRNSLLIMGTHIPVAMTIYNGLGQYLPFSEYMWCADIRGVVYILFYDILLIFLIKTVIYCWKRTLLKTVVKSA